MVFANLLRGLKWEAWRQLIDLLAKEDYGADDQQLAKLLRYKARQDDVTLGAIKNNLLPAIRRLHRSGARLGKNLLEELKNNRVVIVDVSLLGAEDGLAITSMLMRRIFQHNIRHLTDVSAQPLRCLTVLEEAQTFLGDRALDDRNVFARWVKEGRKYGLGCILVTQQPSSISSQIISQGDNFFVLHLLNEVDLQTLKKHNAYFTDDILGFIRGEPIPGNCYFWSAPSQPFVLPARVANFENICQPAAAPTRTKANSEPNAKELRDLTSKALMDALVSSPRVWLYPVSRYCGKKEEGLIAFSREYLQEAIHATISVDPFFKLMDDGARWLHRFLGAEIDAVLRQQKARSGFATLAGSARPVIVLRQNQIKFNKGKSLRCEPVEVVEKL